MTIEKIKENDKLTIVINGVLDASSAPELQKALEGELDDINELYFDMKDMEYTSSVGLRVILNAYQVLEDRGRMVLMHLNDAVKEIFTITGFTNFLEIED